jgi:hypothetical protein
MSTRILATTILATTLAALLAVAGAALAHGDKVHVVGTVTSLAADRMMVKDRSGTNVAIRLSAETRYERDQSPAAAGDLTVGSRVVVDVEGAGDSTTATRIRFASAEATPAHHGEQGGMHDGAAHP